MAKRGRGDFHNGVYGSLRPLNYIIELAGAVDHAVDFNRFAADDIERKIGFDDKYTVTGVFELFVSRRAAKGWVALKVADASVDCIDKGRGMSRTVMCYPVKDGDKVVNGYGKITEPILICHTASV